MTVTERPTTSVEQAVLSAPAYERAPFDLYKDIHKGIRADLFAVTGEAGRLDPADRVGRAALAEHVHRTVDLLVVHAEHEDTHIDPVLAVHHPDLAEHITSDHAVLDRRLLDLGAMADEAVVAGPTQVAGRVDGLYVELASFTSAYLAHQDLEERTVMPALFAAVGFDQVLAIHGAIVGSIPPELMAASLALMLPAMNIDDRADLLGGMRAEAPPEVFEGVWALAGSVLTPAGHRALAVRLDLA
jgi:hypothetical protein